MLFRDYFRPTRRVLIISQQASAIKISFFKTKVMQMTKNPEFAKYASEIAQAQDAIRSANEELIKLSQRLGRMMPKLQRLETSGILSWFNIYNRIKDRANMADDWLARLLNNESVNSNAALQSQLYYPESQKARLYSKMEVMDDILNGIMEDLLDNGSLEESQKEEMRVALDATMGKGKRKTGSEPILA
jgi:hypothetical protein